MRVPIAICAGLLLVCGCKKTVKPDIPVYPDAQGIQGAGTMKGPTTTLFNNRWTTLASVPDPK